MRITIYCGHSLEEFDTTSIMTGVGGSEEAVIQMKRELEKQGHEVEVYGRPTIEGNGWRNYEDILELTDTDVLISWRYAHFIHDQLKHIKASQKYLWLHDMVSENQILPYYLMYDKVFVLSDFHRSHYPHIPDDSMFVTTNGIDLSQFKDGIERVAYRMIYASSYERGLQQLLENWSEIKVHVPEATLTVCYGWNSSEKLNKSESFKSFREYMEHLMDQEGITHMGRLNHLELAAEFQKADIWAYPTWYPETNCITAMKAQAAGAVPVVVPSGAVSETTKYGWLSPFSATDHKMQEVPEKYVDNWRNSLISMLRDRDLLETTRPLMVKEAQNFSWVNTAAAWSNLFTTY
jgi:glycosyltransferase involved in cell wall biosynthesis